MLLSQEALYQHVIHVHLDVPPDLVLEQVTPAFFKSKDITLG